MQAYFVYPQGACRIRKAAEPPTAAQYSKLSEPMDRRKSSGIRRRGSISGFPKRKESSMKRILSILLVLAILFAKTALEMAGLA